MCIFVPGRYIKSLRAVVVSGKNSCYRVAIYFLSRRSFLHPFYGSLFTRCGGGGLLLLVQSSLKLLLLLIKHC